MSAFIQSLIGYLLKTFLDWSLNVAKKELSDAAARKKLDEERKVIDEENEAAYDEAADRAARIEAAKRLLNGEG